MKTKIFLTASALTILINVFGQNPVMEFAFTAIDNTTYVQLDSIKVMNRTQGNDTVLYWPDTVLVLDYMSGITEIDNKGEDFYVFQNFPNPVISQTTITLYLPEKGKVSLVITDILGRQVINTEKWLDKGYHSFMFCPEAGEIFLFTAYWKSTIRNIKILTTSNVSGLTSSLEYIDSKISEPPQFKRIEATQGFTFSLGDTLLFIGYDNTLQSGILDVPETNEDYAFQFATNIPCPGTPIVEYEGQVYNTIQIFSQCWLKENLNVGTMIQGDQEMTDNSILEKYCYNNEPDSCAKYGGLYQWDEMMHYTTEKGSQGICPSGWHIPTDDEWKILEGAVDSQYGIGNQAWDEFGWRGTDAGANLKTSSGWYDGGDGTDLFGFSGQPSGTRDYDAGTFSVNGKVAMSWSSTENEPGIVFYRFLFYDDSKAIRGITVVDYGLSVRCIKD